MTSDLMNAAVEYAQRGWKVFPVEQNAKHPHPKLSKGGYKCATNKLSTIKDWWTADPNANIGLSLVGSGMVCLDADTYKPNCSFAELAQQHELPVTLCQRSASGGKHLIFECQPGDKFPGQLGTSIDIKHNGYILLSPSVFEGKEYVWENAEVIAPAPNWLRKNSILGTSVNTNQLLDETWAESVDIELALRKALSGDSWHNNVLRSVGAMVALGFKDDEIHAKTDLTTTPEYSLSETREEVQTMIDSARIKGFDAGSLQRMQKNLSALNLATDSRRHPICNHSNVSKVLLEHPDWADVFVYNEFTGTEQIIKGMPGEASIDFVDTERALSDADYTRLCIWLNDHQMLNVQKQIIIDAVKHAARQRTINPVKDYLNACMKQYAVESCDGALSTWMEDFLGVVPSSDDERSYVRAVSRLSLIQAVARAKTPGCKADSVVILEGIQGTGKSSAIRTLFGGETFGDQLPPMSSKDASSYLKGKWCVELAELEYKRKAEVETIKAFITRTHENFRPAYGREEVAIPRTNVFFGTTNAAEYLVDETGNRRFLPIATNKIDLAGLSAARDKLWAAACHAYDAGETYWLTDDLMLIASQQAEARLEQDPWVEIVLEKLGHLSEVSIKEAFESCFPEVDTERLTTSSARRMSKVLTLAKWSKDGKFHSGNRRNQVRFVNSNTVANSPNMTKYDF